MYSAMCHSAKCDTQNVMVLMVILLNVIWLNVIVPQMKLIWKDMILHSKKMFHNTELCLLKRLNITQQKLVNINILND